MPSRQWQWMSMAGAVGIVFEDFMGTVWTPWSRWKGQDNRPRQRGQGELSWLIQSSKFFSGPRWPQAGRVREMDHETNQMCGSAKARSGHRRENVSYIWYACRHLQSHTAKRRYRCCSCCLFFFPFFSLPLLFFIFFFFSFFFSFFSHFFRSVVGGGGGGRSISNWKCLARLLLHSSLPLFNKFVPSVLLLLPFYSPPPPSPRRSNIRQMLRLPR